METRDKLVRFEKQVRQAAADIFPKAVLSITERGRYRLKIRIELNDQTFIDIFYNPKNDRTDVALIRANQRLFGYDNLGGWHCNPVENPKTHIPCDEPFFDQVFQEMQTIFDSPPDDPNDHV
jgi:hypothetical protein